MYQSGCSGVNDTTSCEDTMNISTSNITESDSGASSTEAPSMLIRFILETGISMPLSCLGLIGNALAFMVLLRQRPRITTSIHLMALAVADSWVLISTILLRSIRYIYYHMGYFKSYLDIYHYVFLALYPSLYFIRLVCTWLVVLLTVDRYIAVCHPLKAQSSCTVNKARRNILILFVAAALFSLPRYFEHRLDYTSKFKFHSTDLLKFKLYTVIYRVFVYLLVMYLFPMCILVVLNAKLLSALRKAEKQRNEISGTPLKHSQGRSITAIVVIVVTLCIASNTVALSSHLLWSLQLCFESMSSSVDLPRRYISLVSNVLVTFNSAINFVIYVFFSRSFRSILVQTCCFKKGAGYSTISGTVLRMGTMRSETSHVPCRRTEPKLLSDKASPIML